ncbi:HAD family hydrolase [Bacteroidota bacterium]
MHEILKGIKNIIFDFGGVVFTINPQLSVDAFKNLGINNIGDTYAELEKDKLFEQLEKGEITDEYFRNKIREKTRINLSDKQIDEAWCKMLIEYPKENIDILNMIKKRYRLFMLSNTSNIHCHYFTNKLINEFQISFNDIFEKPYYSHQLGMRKPGKEIFLKVIKENKLKPEETLFIDDTLVNIKSANKLKIKSFYLKEGLKLSDIFA